MWTKKDLSDGQQDPSNKFEKKSENLGGKKKSNILLNPDEENRFGHCEQRSVSGCFCSIEIPVTNLYKVKMWKKYVWKMAVKVLREMSDE